MGTDRTDNKSKHIIKKFRTVPNKMDWIMGYTVGPILKDPQKNLDFLETVLKNIFKRALLRGQN